MRTLKDVDSELVPIWLRAPRSAEGRKRIVSELVRSLGGKEEGAKPGAAEAPSPSPAALATVPFKATPGFPAPYKVSFLPACFSFSLPCMPLAACLCACLKRVVGVM